MCASARRMTTRWRRDGTPASHGERKRRLPLVGIVWLRELGGWSGAGGQKEVVDGFEVNEVEDSDGFMPDAKPAPAVTSSVKESTTARVLF
jgi:hypothetical protein